MRLIGLLVRPDRQQLSRQQHDHVDEVAPILRHGSSCPAMCSEFSRIRFRMIAFGVLSSKSFVELAPGGNSGCMTRS